MKASLTLDKSAADTTSGDKKIRARTDVPARPSGPATLPALITPTLGAATTRNTPGKPGKVEAPTRRTAVEASPSLLPTATRLRQRLAAAAPLLFERARPSSEAKLTEILTKRLCALINDATVRVRMRLGEFAASRPPSERAPLQDALVLARLPVEDVLDEATDCFTPPELFALLVSGCITHAPEQLDALRCTEIVCGERQLLAREAVLDLLFQGPGEHSVSRLEGLVQRLLLGRAASVSAAVASSLEDFRAHTAHAEAPRTDTRSRGDLAPSSGERLVQALRRGDHILAADLLAQSAGVSRATVQTAIFLRTAKGLASLAWRGGFDAATAMAIQSVLGHLAPDQLIRPKQDGTFPLTNAEMLWQCRFLARDLQVVN